MDSDNNIDIPASTSPEQGSVIPQFVIDEMLLEKGRDYVMHNKTLFESQRQAWRHKLVDMDKAYRAIIREERAYKGFDDKASPLVHDNVEAIVSRLVESIIPAAGDLVKVDKGLSDQIGSLRTEQLNWQLEKQDVRDKVESVCRQATKFGTCFIKNVLVNDEKPVLVNQLVTKTQITPIVDDNDQPILDPSTGQPQVHVEETKNFEVVPHIDKKYFGPGYHVINDPEDVYLDMFIEDIQDQPIVIHRLLVDWDHLQEGIEKGIYFSDKVDQIKEVIFNDIGGNSFNNLRRSQEILTTTRTFGQDTTVKRTARPRQYEMFQAYCNFAVKQMQEDGSQMDIVYPCVISVIGNKCIQLMPNPYFHQMKPFVKVVYRKIEGEAFGLSAIDPVLGLYHEYNDTMNQINDSKVLALNPVRIQRAGSLADQQDLDIYPGAVWYEKNTGDIRNFSMDFTTVANGVQYLALLEQRINAGMGISPLMQGQGDTADLDKTWRGTQKVIAQADKKFKLIAKGIENAAIKDWSEMAYKVNVQFNPVGQLTGGENFEEINSELNFKVFGVESFFEKQEKIERYLNFTMQAAQLPGMNMPGLVQQIAEMQDIQLDPKFGQLYIPPAPPPPESKPMNMSVSIPLDPSKGSWIGMAAAQLLAKKEGIELDLDAIQEATELVSDQDERVKAEQGTLPPRFDSYSERDRRSADADRAA